MLKAMTVAAMVLASSYRPVKFGVVGDTQERRWVLRKIVADMKTRELDFVSHLGDVWHCAHSRAWKNISNLTASTGVPWFFTLGNHDLGWCGKGRYSMTPLRRKFAWYWNGARSTMFSWTRRRWHFISFDNATEWTPNKHVAWMRRRLSGSTGPVVLFAHRAAACATSVRVRHGRRTIWQSRMDPPFCRRQDRRLWKVIKAHRHRVKGFFHGHFHGWVRKYYAHGVPTWCSGGGGGTRQRSWDPYHWLEVTASNGRLSVSMRKVSKR